MANKLSPDAIDAWLSANPSWSRDGDMIRKTYQFDAFADSVSFVDRIAPMADEMNHHPDIDIRYNKVHIGLTTHDLGGLSDFDTALAEKLDGAV